MGITFMGMGMALIPMGINSHPIPIHKFSDAVFSICNSNVQLDIKT